MWLKEIWRYPVKSMAGEILESAELGEGGIAGDRLMQVRNDKGRIFNARTRPLLLRHHATLSADGQVLVDGRPWDSAEVAADVLKAAGDGTYLVRRESDDRFDVLPLLIATDGMLAAVGYDRRRYRPNLIIGGLEGLTEREWESARLRIGSVVIAMRDLRQRCIMTTFDPDTGEQDTSILRRVQTEFGGTLGLNASVVNPGRVRTGDNVELLRA